jgi:hypothetical protein
MHLILSVIQAAGLVPHEEQCRARAKAPWVLERAELVDLSRDEAGRGSALIPNAKLALPYLR